MHIVTNTTEETQAFSLKIQKKYPDVKIWLLYGNLASGKTTFVKGLKPKAKSPTFTYVTEYDNIIHYDLYRLEHPDQDMKELLQEHLSDGRLVIIEWPEVIESTITQPHIKITFKHEGGDKRSITLLHSL